MDAWTDGTFSAMLVLNVLHLVLSITAVSSLALSRVQGHLRLTAMLRSFSVQPTAPAISRCSLIRMLPSYGVRRHGYRTFVLIHSFHTSASRSFLQLDYCWIYRRQTNEL